MNLSVIVCTHNPKEDTFYRVLTALEGQTYSKKQWELIVVDNCSDEELAKAEKLKVPKNGRYIREETLGLTPARLRGIKESKGDILIFVDDDNVLGDNYLETAASIGGKWPTLGVWGGQRLAEWEVEPPEWILRYKGMLSVSEVTNDIWHNFSRNPSVLPTGAGMCVRRRTALRYIEILEKEPLRKLLDRTGSSLGSCGDYDIIFSAMRNGEGVGLFPGLVLTHIIAKERLQKEYIMRLREEISYSYELLALLDGEAVAEKEKICVALAKSLYRRTRFSTVDYMLQERHFKGVRKAHKMWRKLEKQRFENKVH